jgi:hypothetical protein
MLCVCVVSAAVASRHWPLVGDASLMHYVIFLRQQGLLPYKDIVEINLPGTYFAEALAMRCFGTGTQGWRIYDFFLLLSILGAALVFAGKRRVFAGFFAGAMFSLIHLQDGIAQGGQRDLLMAALLLWAYVALFRAQNASDGAPMALLYGVLIGCTVMIKPVLLPLGLVLLLAAGWVAHRRGLRAWRLLGAGTIGIALPCITALLWLKGLGVLQSFFLIFRDLLPLHAELGRQPLSFLFFHCFSPIALIAGLWIALQLLKRQRFSVEKSELLMGTLGTLLVYIAQGKGYPYQRYPFLAVLLVIIGLDLDHDLSEKGPRRVLAGITCFLSCFVLAPRYAWLASSFTPDTPFQTALTGSLLQLGSPEQLSGRVQCLDTFGGCINSLYDLKVRQSTGFLYDCYLFTPESAERQQYRHAFWKAYQSTQPWILIETSQFCFGDSLGFRKLEKWPLFAMDIENRYILRSEWKSPALEHWWSRREEPAEFRIYTLKQDQSQQ